MAVQAKSIVDITIKVLEAHTSVGAGNVTLHHQHTISVLKNYANGTGANQNDLVWSDTADHTTSQTDRDLAGGLTDMNGNTMTFVEVTLIAVKNNSTTASENLHIGNDANHVPIFGATGDYVIVGPEGYFIWASPSDGVTVTATTGDILGIAASTGTISADILIVGRSA